MPVVLDIPGCSALYVGTTLIWLPGVHVVGRTDWAFTSKKLRVVFSGKVTADFDQWDGSTGKVPRHLLNRWKIVSVDGSPVNLPPIESIEYRNYGTTGALNIVFASNYTGPPVPEKTSIVIAYPPKGS